MLSHMKVQLYNSVSTKIKFKLKDIFYYS